MRASRLRTAVKSGIAGCLMLAAAVSPGIAQRPDEGGVTVRRPSFVRHLVSAERLEKAAEQQFVTLKGQADTRRVLLPKDDPQSQRVARIARELLPFADKWNPRAKEWKWDVVVIKSKTINAFCMPGGKIAFFTGILDTLQLTDDETAMVMGHEMAHALREHARARSAKMTLTNVGAFAVGVLFGDNYGQIAQQSGGLLTLKFNRDDERDADLIGMEMAARAGYDPRSGIALWEKMSKAQKGAPPQWLSTHPSHEDRIARITKALPKVMPLYERARAEGLPRKSAAN
jgi:predicted Zn-dependent protease